MRVAFVVGRFPLISETFILNEITGLLERGHAVSVYSLYGRPEDAVKVHADVERYDLLSHTRYVPKVPRSRFRRVAGGVRLLIANGYKDPLVSLRSLNVMKFGRQSASLRLLYRSLPLLGCGAYDIVHCQFGTLGNAGLTLKDIGALRGRWVTSFRGYDISQHISRHGDHVYDELFRTGDLFLTNCDYFKHRLLGLGCDPDRLVVHRSGVDCFKFGFAPRYPPPDGRVRIAMVGRLVEKKGAEFAIRAIAKVATSNKSVEFNLIGDGPLRKDLEGLVEELKVGNVVKLLGWKDQGEVIEVLKDSHIFVAPSVTARDGDQDAPNNVLKEAMATGLPVVSTRHGGIPELVEDGHTGLLVPERDVGALADKLGHLIENPKLWPRMGMAARKCVEDRYNLDRLNDELVETYRRLVTESDERRRERLHFPVSLSTPPTNIGKDYS